MAQTAFQNDDPSTLPDGQLIDWNAGAATDATQRTISASDSPDVTVLGATTDAVVSAGAAGSISAKLRAISRDLVANIVLAAGSAIIGKVGIDQTTPGTTDRVTAGGLSFNVAVEKTRPANTTAYTANDAIAESAGAGTVWAFAIARATGKTGTITRAKVACDVTTETERLQLDLYSTVTAINDNDEATRLYANEASFIGTITFPALAKRTTSSTAAEASVEGVNMPFVTSGSANVVGILRTLDAFTPGSGKKYTVSLSGYED